MNTPVIEPLLLHERDAAKMLAVSQSQLAKMRYRGEVQAVLFGKNCVRYAIEDLRALIAHSKGLQHAP
jgi:hypothetical protein